MERLSAATLSRCSAELPHYHRGDIRPGVVHLGLGAFARAHLCTTLDDVNARNGAGWGVTGVSLRHHDVPDALVPQDGLYTLGVIDGHELRARVIGSVLSVLHAPSQSEQVRAALASSATSVVSVTVTEKGYCWEPATKRLDHRHPDVIHDLANPGRPRTVLGHLALAAADRRRQGGPPLTVLSLDNLPSNGATLSTLLGEFTEASDPTLASWIAEHFSFPSSMVDRMVPATDDDFRATVARAIGFEDAWPVRAEPFSQWVVERNWATPMPEFDVVGVHPVDDVAPWEHLKLRVLNALHTVAALHGLRYGLDTVADVAADRAGRELLGRVADEIREVVTPPVGVDVDRYIATTFERFENTGLRHRCAQIATDSSQKLPQRLLVSLAERRGRGLSSEALLDAVALWAWSTLGVDSVGTRRDVHDPLAMEFAAIASRANGDVTALTRALVGLPSVFGASTGDPELIHAIAARLAVLVR